MVLKGLKAKQQMKQSPNVCFQCASDIKRFRLIYEILIQDLGIFSVD